MTNFPVTKLRVMDEDSEGSDINMNDSFNNIPSRQSSASTSPKQRVASLEALHQNCAVSKSNISISNSQNMKINVTEVQPNLSDFDVSKKSSPNLQTSSFPDKRDSKNNTGKSSVESKSTHQKYKHSN